MTGGILGTHRTITAGVSPGHLPAVSLVETGLGVKLNLELGSTAVLLALGTNPREALTALRDGLSAVLNETETPHG